MTKADQTYCAELEALQIELVKAQTWWMDSGRKLVVLFEGRDGSGKDGTIKRVTEYQSSRNTRVIALPKPSDRQQSQWYFQRYVRHLPAAGEWVLFNRSWYNRAGVERVMGFATPQQQEQFLLDALDFETMLINSGIVLVKFWLDIDKSTQAKRLAARRSNPLKNLKISDLDAVAQKEWKAYSQARNEMLTRTDSANSPWICVRADHKKAARLNVIRHLLKVLDRPDAERDWRPPDPDVVFRFEPAAITDGRLAK